MQVKFRYTNKEFLRSRRVNKMAGTPKWKIFGLVALTLVPSILLAVFTESTNGLLAISFVGSIMFILMTWVLMKQPVMTDQHEHTMTLTSESLLDEISHSASEIHWARFDEFIEAQTEFRFRRLDRFVILPKRIFTAEQIDELRGFASAVQQEITDDLEVDLSAKHFVREQPLDPEAPRAAQLIGQHRLYEFRYLPADLLSAFQDQLQVIDQTKPEQQAPKTVSGCMPILFIFMFLTVAWIYGSTPYKPITKNTWNLFNLLLISGLPFLFLIGAMRWIRTQNFKRLPELPNESSKLILTKTGFAFGSKTNVSFTEWRDVESFYQNRSVFGFKMPNEIIQLVPKRIFADQSETQNFIDHTMMLHREYLRTFVVTATAVESGNPFQAPGS